MADPSDGFLQRWSRRKQEAAKAKDVPATPAAADPAEIEKAAAEARAREAALTQERDAVLARLPKLEDLTAATDFRLFMHPLVPAALRSAALSRMWTLDPAIRDFVGPARDYAWDWNVPGGVPGGGPAPSLADVQATLRQLTARLDAEAARGAEQAEPSAAEAPIEAAEAAPARLPPAASATRLPEAPARAAAPAIAPAAEPVVQGSRPEAAPVAAARRRHGGATPG